MLSPLKYILPLAAAMAVHPIHAQVLSPGWETYVTLTQADLDMIKAALADRIHNQRAGSSVAWRNPASGNFGSLMLRKTFTRNGRRCEEIEYRLSPPERNPSDRFVLTSCVQSDGSWKLS